MHATRIRNARAEHYLMTSQRRRQRSRDTVWDTLLLAGFAALKLSVIVHIVGGAS